MRNVRIVHRWVAALLLFQLFFCSCRTLPPLPPVDLAEPGWKLRQGQAVWRTERDAPEVAGEILFATHPAGGTMLQLTKNPLPFVTVQTRGEAWEIEIVPKRRRFAGTGIPTKRLLWVHLARALNGGTIPEDLRFQKADANGFALENLRTGESITGFLAE
jgi:hypothetical protein